MINKFSTKLKQTKGKIFASLMFIMVLAVPAFVLAGFGPNRPVFDWNNPDDRKGSMTGPVFNSFINTPTYGDERNFVRVAPVVAGQSPVDADFSETNTAEAGKEYWVRTFVHNDANQSTNDSGLGIARNTRVSMQIPDGTVNGLDIMSNVTADNATPNKVWDTATLVNDNRAFSVDYIAGSAKLYNRAHQGGISLSDSIMTPGGVAIGYDQMNGNLPGCFEFSAYIYVKVKVTSPNLDIDKRVSKLAEPKLADASESVSVKRGETVTWRIDYRNTGSEVAKDITIRDQLPEGLQLVPGSITWFDVNHQNGEQLQDTALGSGGVNVGNYAVNGNGMIRFRTVVNPSDPKICEIVNVAFGRAENVPEQRDDAKVIIEDCKPEVKEPVYSCDMLTKLFVEDSKYRFTVEATAENGATIKQYRYDFGDDSDELVTDNNVVEHTFPGPGTYVITATVDVDVDGRVRSATSENCKVAIEIPKEEEKCPIPGKEHLPVDSPECVETPDVPITPAVTTLPETGAGAIAGIFTATSAAGAIAHRLFYGRRK